jgi:hypothetical protein
MDKNFIPYEESVALEALGFNEPCFAGYSILTEKIEFYSKPLLTRDSFTVDAPTYSQAFRWFREKHKLYHTINMFGDWDKPQYGYLVSGRTMNNPAHMWYFEDKDSHEDAELACLIKLIEIVKNNE